MKCKKCGHKNKRSAQFCISCGEPLEQGPKIPWLVLVLVGIIVILVIAVGFMVSNNYSLNSNSAPIEEIVNNTTDNNDTVIEEAVNNTADNTQNNSIENKSPETNIVQDVKSTLNTGNIDSEVIEIYGVPFTVPKGGSYRSACTYQFEFKGQLCEVEEVEHYESSDSERTIEPYQFSKSYPGGESYMLTVNNHVWKGIKVEKSSRWYHISMKTNNDNDVLEMLDWMSERNTWVGNN